MGTLLQFETLSSATVQETFTSGTTLTDLDGGVGAVPVVTITRPDGTTIAPGTVTRVSTGLFQFVLAGQPNPTILTVTWTGTIGGQSQTRVGTVEILGASLFTVAEFRALRVGGGTPFATTATPLFTDAQIHQVRAEILEEMTDILGFSPVPRFVRETHTVSSGGTVRLLQPEPTRLLSVTIAGVAQTIGNYTIGPGDTLAPVTGYTASGWTTTGVNNVTVEYVAGWPRPLGKGGRVAMMWAAAELQPSLYSTAQTVTTADGESYTYEPSETGRFGFQRYTGIKAVDKWLNLHGPKVGASA